MMPPSVVLYADAMPQAFLAAIHMHTYFESCILSWKYKACLDSTTHQNKAAAAGQAVLLLSSAEGQTRQQYTQNII